MDWLRTIWLVLSLRCEEADRIRTRMRLGEAARAERVAERVHRALCRGCRHAASQLERIDRAIEHLAADVGDGPVAEWTDARRARLDAALREADERG